MLRMRIEMIGKCFGDDTIPPREKQAETTHSEHDVKPRWLGRARKYCQKSLNLDGEGNLSHQPCNLSAGFRLYQKRPDGFAQRFIALTAGSRPTEYLTQPETAREPAVHVERKMRY